jgi:hypothetical protein
MEVDAPKISGISGSGSINLKGPARGLEFSVQDMRIVMIC